MGSGSFDIDEHTSRLGAMTLTGLAFTLSERFAQFVSLEAEHLKLALADLLHLGKLPAHGLKLTRLHFKHPGLVANLLGLLAERLDRKDRGYDGQTC
jgi:hypothetical protein